MLVGDVQVGLTSFSGADVSRCGKRLLCNISSMSSEV